MQDQNSTTVDEVTGVHPVHPGMGVGPQRFNDGMSKGDWIRIVIWSIPVLFMAATMYVTLDHVTERQHDHAATLNELEKTTSDLKTEQRVSAGKVTEIEKKQDTVIRKVEGMDEKLDDQSEDLAAIREKLKIER